MLFATVAITGAWLIVKVLWSENRDLRSQREKDRESAAEQERQNLIKTLTVNQEAVAAMRASEDAIDAAMKAVESATVMMHMISGRQYPAEQLSELNLHLRSLREIREKELRLKEAEVDALRAKGTAT